MAKWRRDNSPVDRALDDLNKQIAELQRQTRAIARQPEEPPAPGVTRDATGMTKIKSLFGGPQPETSQTQRTRQDLFDLNDQTIQLLEADTAATPPGTIGPVSSPATAAGAAQVTPPAEKLLHYLSPESVRVYKPIKRIQRRDRNRFVLWLGLALATLWMLYVVVR